MSSKQVVRLVAAAILLLGGLWLTAGSAPATDGPSVVQLMPQADTVQLMPQADSPSPTLGSTQQENPAPRGDQDGDPADFSQVPWVFFAILGFVAVVAVVLGVYLLRRRNRAPR